jgi:hypothetical protein
MLDEFGIAPVAVEDRDMVMVRHRAHEQDVDPVSKRRDEQAIEVRIVRLGIGTEQELPLRAAPRE